jgi:DNA polymerase-1
MPCPTCATAGLPRPAPSTASSTCCAAAQGLPQRLRAPACSTPRARPSATTGTRNTRRTARRCRTTWQQIEPLHEAVRALGWPLLMVDGVEADDVIGTLTRRPSAGMEACLHRRQGSGATGQSHVSLVNTMTNEVLDEAGVLAKFGVPPAHRRLPDADRRQRRQRARRRQGRAEDRGQMAHRISATSTPSWRAPAKSVAWSGRTCASAGWLPMGRLEPQAPAIERLREMYARLEFKTWLRELQPGADEAAGATPAPSASSAAPAGDPPVRIDDGSHRDRYACILDRARSSTTGWRKHGRRGLRALDTETDQSRPAGGASGWHIVQPLRRGRPPICRCAHAGPARLRSCRF